MYFERNQDRTPKAKEGDAGEDTPDGSRDPAKGPELDWNPRPLKVPAEALPGFENIGPAEGDPDHIFRSAD
jgi:hypothetical protein